MRYTFLTIFISALILNLLWEEAHSVLYVYYKGEPITHFVLLRAALFDATIITVFSFPFLQFVRYRRKQWPLFAALTVFAIGLEKWALRQDAGSTKI